MKGKKIFLSVFLSLVISLAVFFGISVPLLMKTDKKAEAEVKDYTVPYAAYPENSGLLFNFPSGSAAVIYLDFEKGASAVIMLQNAKADLNEIYGYKIDYRFEFNYDIIEYMVDLSGGVVLGSDEGNLRYTGSQLVQMLGTSSDNFDLLKLCLPQILKGIEKNGFSRSDFVYIIENSDTNLKITDCYSWDEYIVELFQNMNTIE